MNMLNNVVLIGRLTKDPELKQTGSGQAYTNFTLAVNRTFKNANGETEADFINIVAWRKTAELVCNYLGKGRLVAVNGRIQTRNYENAEGQRIYVTEVVAESVTFLDRAPAGNEQTGQGQGQERTYNQPQNYSQPQNQPQNQQDSQPNQQTTQPGQQGRDIFSGLPF